MMIETSRLILREMIGDCGLTMQNIGGMIKPENGYHIRGDCQRKAMRKKRHPQFGIGRFKTRPFRRSIRI